MSAKRREKRIMGWSCFSSRAACPASHHLTTAKCYWCGAKRPANLRPPFTDEERLIEAAEQAHCLLDGMVRLGKIEQHECRNTFQKLSRALAAIRATRRPRRAK